MFIQALQKVYRKPTYVVLTLGVSMAVFALVVWMPNIRLIASVVTAEDVAFLSKLKLPLNLLGSIATNFTLLSASYTIAISILFGMYLAMTIYLLRRRAQEAGQAGIATGLLGIGSGVLGVGCAACGSSLFSSFLLFSGASGIVALLPLGGSEFGILGVVLLGVAVYMTAKQVENPLVCKTES